MARATKHRNRILKKKIYTILKRQVQPQFQILPKKRFMLMKVCFQKFKEYRIKNRVKSHKVKKARIQYSRQMLQKYFQRIGNYVSEKQSSKQEQNTYEYKIQKLRRKNSLRKGIKSL